MSNGSVLEALAPAGAMGYTPGMFSRLLLLLSLGVLGCQPKIGDACNLSTDCSIRGDRVCDTSQPRGYCTVLGCLGHPKDKFDSPGACPQNSACVAINPGVPGCGYDDRRSPSRSTRTLCLAVCKQDSDCRAGYRCELASGEGSSGETPFFGRALDDGPTPKVCVPKPYAEMASMLEPDAAVCSPNPPPVTFDASAPADAGTDAADAGTMDDASADAGDEGGADAQGD